MVLLLAAGCSAGGSVEDDARPPEGAGSSAASDRATSSTAGSIDPDATDATDTPGPTIEQDDADLVRPNGFDLTAAIVTTPDGDVCELCLWLADDADQRRRGLMFVTDLGVADGMAFRYPTPHTGRFWMKDTLLPLSIAFFDPDGEFVEAFDMEPCASEPCPRYRTPTDFLVAVEVVRGGLDGVGMVDGSTLELLDRPCELES